MQDIRFVHTSSSADTVTVERVQRADLHVEQRPSGSKSRIELKGVSLLCRKSSSGSSICRRASTRVRAVSAFKSGDAVILEADRALMCCPRSSHRATRFCGPLLAPVDTPSSETGIGLDGGAARKTRTVAREAGVVGLPAVETSFNDAVVRARGGDAIIETRSAPEEAGAFSPAVTDSSGKVVSPAGASISTSRTPTSTTSCVCSPTSAG